MIKTTTCLSAACDACGYQLDEDDDGIIHFDTTEAALEYARDAGWWATDKAILCAGVDDDEHGIKVAEIADEIAKGDADGTRTDEFLKWCEKAGYDLDDEPETATAVPGQVEIPAAPEPSTPTVCGFELEDGTVAYYGVGGA
jgi:hypothetical protein